MAKWSLPSGWKWQTLSSVADDTDRRNPSTQPDREFLYVDIGSVDPDNGVIKLDEVSVLLGEQAPSRARKVILKNDIVFATTRPYLKNIALVPIKLDNQICSTGFCVIRAKDGIAHPNYLYHACRSGFFIEQLLLKQRGANYPAVVDSDVFVNELPIPYPDDPTRSLAEQRRIVARIETLFAELRECRALNEKIEMSTNRLMESLLVEILPPVHEKMPHGWSLQQIKNIADKPQYGYTQSAKQEPVGPKFLRITDIQEGKVDWDSVPYCECDQNTFQKYRLIDKDIVFARSGATTGKTFLVKSPPQAVFASYLIRLKIRKALPEYVSWFFQSRDYWKQITPIGAAIPNMNAQVLQELRIPIPDSESAQRLIVERCRQFEGEVSEMVRTQAGNSIILDKVEQSVLAQAFRGEL